MPQAEVFVLAAGFHLAHPELGGDVGGVFKSGRSVGGEDDLEGRALSLDDTLGKTADYIKTLLVDVIEP
jgi:hypothetical protein